MGSKRLHCKTAKYNFLKDSDLNRECISRIPQEVIGTTILEIGCGRGYMIETLSQNKKLRITGTDIFFNNPIQHIDNVTFATCSVNHLPFPDQYFDTTLCTHVLEHVRDIQTAIREIRRVTSKRMIIVIPKERPYRFGFNLHLTFFPCYPAMDKLLQRQSAIQKKLAHQHLQSGHLILYDITSVYFEGEYKASELVTFGYNRDRKQGREQMVVGLICNGQGCPVGVEVYAGNTKDETTVIDKIQQIKVDYGIEKIIFVGDRGMVTQNNIEALKDEDDLKTIGALTHGDFMRLLKEKVIQLDLFDEQTVHEVVDPTEPNRRYCLCRNPATAERETQTRQRLLDLTETGNSKFRRLIERSGKVFDFTRVFTRELGIHRYPIGACVTEVAAGWDGIYDAWLNSQ